MIQKIWQDIMLRPKYKRPLNVFTKSDRLTVAFSRPPNLANLLSARNLKTHNGLPVSSYTMITDQAGASERDIEREREIEKEIELEQETSSIGSNDASSHDIIPHRSNIFSQFINKNL